MIDTKLFRLLDRNLRNEEDIQSLDGDAIIKEVQQNPHSAEIKYRFSHGRRWFPLHQAIRLRAPVEVIDSLCFPEALVGKSKNEDNDDNEDERSEDDEDSVDSYEDDPFIAIHHALRFQSSSAIVKLLLDKEPRTIQYKTEYGDTTLQLACLYRAPFEVISLLVNAWPEALELQDWQKNTPLHAVLQSDYEAHILEVVSLFLNICPDACKAKDVNLCTPLHIACRHGQPVEVVSLLVDAWPGALQKRHKNRYLPLHVVCNNITPNWKVVVFLLGSWPNASRQKDPDGNTALHLVSEKKCPLEVLSLIIDSYPGAVRERNNVGDIPLHRACRAELSFEETLLLLDTWPEAIMEKGYCSGKTPLDLVQKSTSSEDTKTLLSYTSAIFNDRVTTDDNGDPSPNEIMNFFVNKQWWKGVRLLIDRYPAIVRTMNLHTSVKADFLSMIGRHCTLKTMWEVIFNEQDLLAGAL